MRATELKEMTKRMHESSLKSSQPSKVSLQLDVRTVVTFPNARFPTHLKSSFLSTLFWKIFARMQISESQKEQPDSSITICGWT